MTRSRVLLWVAAPLVVVAAIVLTIRAGRRAPVGHQGSTTASEAAEGHNELPRRDYPSFPTQPTADELRAALNKGANEPAVSPSSPLHRDSNDYAREIAETTKFKAFASSASLSPDEQAQVSHILALYFMDEESLRNTASDPEKYASMRRQLLVHMHVRVRAKIPSKWEAFEEADLLPRVSDSGNAPT
jgi:hypothetical protein